MPPYLTAIIIVLLVIIMLAAYIWSLYNSLVKLNERVEEAFKDITVQLKYRADLLPNLVNTVKGFAKHEKETLENVIKARASATSATSFKDIAAADSAVESALGRLLMVSEKYPELKANENFLELQHDIEDIENKIQAARRFYNAGVEKFNVKVKVFPTNIFAKKLGFSAREYYDVDESEKAIIKNAPKVEF